MTSRRSTRSSRGNKKVDILLTDINSYSTCIDLSLIRSLCCDNCLGIFDASRGLMKKSSHSKKRFRDQSQRRRCYQPWASIHSRDTATSSTYKKYVRTRNYFNIKLDVAIDSLFYDEAYKVNSANEKSTSSTSLLPEGTANVVVPILPSSPLNAIVQGPTDPPSESQRQQMLDPVAPPTPLVQERIDKTNEVQRPTNAPSESQQQQQTNDHDPLYVKISRRKFKAL